MSFAAGVAVGFAMAKKMFEGGEVEEEWTPPADWPVVPEPSDYEIYFLIKALTEKQVFSFVLTNPLNANTGCGDLTIDWGDGTVVSFADGEWTVNSLYHTYEDIGKYVVKISATETSCFFQYINQAYENSVLLMAKLGDEIVINNGSDSHTQLGFRAQYRVQYVKLGGKGGLARQQTFGITYALHKVDITIPPTTIPAGTFSAAYSLKKFDFSEVAEISNDAFLNSGFTKIYMPKCTSVGIRGISSCAALHEVDLPSVVSIGDNGIANNPYLKSVNAPLCMSIGKNGMYNDYTIEKVTVAEGCSFGTGCFSGCYNLIPHPDGSTN